MGVISPIFSQIKTRQSSLNCLQKGEDICRGRVSLSLSPHLRIQEVLKGSLDLAPQFQGRQAGNPHRPTLACCLVKVREQSLSVVYWTDVSQTPGWFPEYLYISSGNNPALFSSQARSSSRTSVGISWAPQSALKYDRQPVLENLQLLKARVNYPKISLPLSPRDLINNF